MVDLLGAWLWCRSLLVQISVWPIIYEKHGSKCWKPFFEVWKDEATKGEGWASSFIYYALQHPMPLCKRVCRSLFVWFHFIILDLDIMELRRASHIVHLSSIMSKSNMVEREDGEGGANNQCNSKPSWLYANLPEAKPKMAFLVIMYKIGYCSNRAKYWIFPGFYTFFCKFHNDSICPG